MSERELRLRRRVQLLQEIAEIENRVDREMEPETYIETVTAARTNVAQGNEAMTTENVQKQREVLIKKRRQERQNRQIEDGELEGLVLNDNRRDFSGIYRRWSEPAEAQEQKESMMGGNIDMRTHMGNRVPDRRSTIDGIDTSVRQELELNRAEFLRANTSHIGMERMENIRKDRKDVSIGHSVGKAANSIEEMEKELRWLEKKAAECGLGIERHGRIEEDSEEEKICDKFDGGKYSGPVIGNGGRKENRGFSNKYHDSYADEHISMHRKDSEKGKQLLESRDRQSLHKKEQNAYDRSKDIVATIKKEEEEVDMDYFDRAKIENDVRMERELKENIEKLRLQDEEIEKELELKERLMSLKNKQMEIDRINTKHREHFLQKEKLRKLREEETRLRQELLDKNRRLRKMELGLMERKDSVNQEQQEATVHQKELTKGYLTKPTIPKLTETTFEEWKIEVEVVMKSGLFHGDILRQAIRNSLTGQTRKILLTLNPAASTKEIVQKLENIYGNIRSGESMLSEFYMSKQRKEEGVSDWGVRLEGIVQTAIDKGQISENQRDRMLKTRFWRHLYDEDLKNATRMYFETVGSFAELRRLVRREEYEIKATKSGDSEKHIEQPTRKVEIQQVQGEEPVKLLSAMLTRMKKLEEQIAEMKRENQERKKLENGSARKPYAETEEETKGSRNVGPRGRAQFRGGYSGRRGSNTWYRNRYHTNDRRNNNGRDRNQNQTESQQEADKVDKSGGTESKEHLNQ